MSSLVVSGLVKRYDEKIALDGVSLQARSGQLAGLVGSNGAGKTTLFQSVAALIRIDAGSVLVDGAERGSIAARRAVGYLPEEPVLWPDLTVAEHLQFIARAYSVPDWKAKAADLLERMRLADARDAKGGGLSQGMRRKVALAMVLLHDSSVLLLDEPFNGIDPEAQHELRTIVRELRDRGTCIVLASHRLAELEALADCYVVLAKGKVVADGSLAELRSVIGAAHEADLETIYLSLMA
jgi:ABC-2 type transport system ATP-binding protein